MQVGAKDVQEKSHPGAESVMGWRQERSTCARFHKKGKLRKAEEETTDTDAAKGSKKGCWL